MRDLCADLRRRGIVVVFGRVNPFLREDMDRHGITAAVGAENIFVTLHEALAAVRAKDGRMAAPPSGESRSTP